ncbi:MAG: DUF481 domain-containing protein [Myxococcota bacterium]
MGLLLAVVNASFAQVNGEPLAAAAAQEGIGFQFTTAGSWSQGNVDFLQLSGNLAVQYRRNFRNREDAEGEMRDRAILSARGLLLQLNGAPFADQRLVHLRYTRMANPRLGVDVVAQYENNLLLLLEGRYTVGAALGWQAVDNETWGLHFGLGPLLEHEVRNVDPEGPDPRLMTNPRLVFANRLNVVLVPNELTLSNTLYVEPRVDDPGDILIVDYFALNAPISKALTMNGNLTVRHDSRPPVPVQNTDVTVGWGFTLRLAARPDPHEPH